MLEKTKNINGIEIDSHKSSFYKINKLKKRRVL